MQPIPYTGSRRRARPASRPSVQADAGVDCGATPDARLDPRPHLARRESVSDVLVRPRLSVDHAPDRAIGQHERAAAVAAIDLRAELEDESADAIVAIDVAPSGRVATGDGRRQDR